MSQKRVPPRTATEPLNDLGRLESLSKKSALYAWSQGLERCEEFAQAVYLCPTNVCNHRCVTCGYDNMRRGHKKDGSPERGYMPWPLFKKIVSELPPGGRRLYLQKTGESLLHPRITDMMQLLRRTRPDYELALHTNASVLDKRIGSAVLENLDFFSLSVFGFDRASFAKAHGRDDFKTVMKNIHVFHDQYVRSRRKIKVYFDVVRNQHIHHLSNEEIFRFLSKRFPAFNIGVHFPFNFQGFVKEYDMQVFNNISYQHYPALHLALGHDGHSLGRTGRLLCGRPARKGNPRRLAEGVRDAGLEQRQIPRFPP
ncbi:MAG: radical SAM protein [Fibrobacterota bacterium]